MELFDFSIHFPAWTPIGDPVMGGSSESAFDAGPDGAARFHGTLRPGPSGGFASVRSAPVTIDLAGAAGLSLLVCGDGRRYKISLRTDGAEADGVQYQASFAPARGVWTELRISFERFRPTFRGRELEEAPPLSPGTIASLGLVIADGQAGEFCLKLRRIATYP